jgi:hypothetical protein
MYHQDMENNSNRYPQMKPVTVAAGPDYLPGYIVCPVCSHHVKLNAEEIGYHGGNGGAFLCGGSGYPVGAIITPIKIISVTKVLHG